MNTGTPPVSTIRILLRLFLFCTILLFAPEEEAYSQTDTSNGRPTHSAEHANGQLSQSQEASRNPTLYLPLAIPASATIQREPLREGMEHTPEIVYIRIDSQAQYEGLNNLVALRGEITAAGQRWVMAIVEPQQKSVILSRGYQIEVDRMLTETYGRSQDLMTSANIFASSTALFYDDLSVAGPSPVPFTVSAGNGSSPEVCTVYASTDVPKILPVGTASISSGIVIQDMKNITDLNVKMQMLHGWVGDLTATLSHVETNTVVTLLDQPGVPGSNWGCSNNNIDATFDDSSMIDAEDQCSSSGVAISSVVKPHSPLSAFTGLNSNGTWIMTVEDAYVVADSGTLQNWHIEICTDDLPPTATPVPTVTGTPVPPTPTPKPTVGDFACKTYLSDDVPHDLPVNESTITSSIFINHARTIEELKLNLNMNHSWVGDLIIALEHEETGKSLVIMDRPGVPGTIWGCNRDDIFAVLEDDALLPVEETCGSGLPAIGGSLKPNNPLNLFNGQTSAGTWNLIIEDAYPLADGGSLVSWGLDVCNE